MQVGVWRQCRGLGIHFDHARTVFLRNKGQHGGRLYQSRRADHEKDLRLRGCLEGRPEYPVIQRLTEPDDGRPQ